MSSEPHRPRATFPQMLVSVGTLLALLVVANAATVGPRGIWQLADYDFAVPEYWPQALKIGRELQALADSPAPRWAVAGSSSVLYDVIPQALADAVRARGGQPPYIAELAVQQAVFSDTAILTQVAHRRAPLEVAIVGVHPRDFDLGRDPRTTLVARMFDDARVTVRAVEGGSPARRVERAVAAVWPAFRLRRLQTRVFHAFLPAPPTFTGADPAPKKGPPAPARYDANNTPTENNPQFEELRRWIQWCRAEDVRPIVVYFPVLEGYPEALWPRAHGDAWIAALEAELLPAGVTFINARDAMPPSAFFDFNHLHEQGAVGYSAWLGRRLADELVAAP